MILLRSQRERGGREGVADEGTNKADVSGTTEGACEAELGENGAQVATMVQ